MYILNDGVMLSNKVNFNLSSFTRLRTESQIFQPSEETNYTEEIVILLATNHSLSLLSAPRYLDKAKQLRQVHEAPRALVDVLVRPRLEHPHQLAVLVNQLSHSTSSVQVVVVLVHLLKRLGCVKDVAEKRKLGIQGAIRVL